MQNQFCDSVETPMIKSPQLGKERNIPENNTWKAVGSVRHHHIHL